MRIKRRSDLMREKRRKARERLQKIRDEQKRAREVQEEKWTTKNEFLLIAEHRKLQRCAHINVIRKECDEEMKVVLADQKGKNERKELLKNEIQSEIREMNQFIEETCAYYDEIHQQISPPEEKSVENIVADIEAQLIEMYNIFHSTFNFDPKMPNAVEMDAQIAEKDKAFVNDINQLENEIEKNRTKSENLVKEIAEVKTSIEIENVRFAAIKKDKITDKMLKSKKIARIEEKLKFIEEDPIERGEIINIYNRKNAVKREKQTIDKMIDDVMKILQK